MNEIEDIVLSLTEWSRRADEQYRERAAETADLMETLRRLAEAEGPASIYARCLAEIERWRQSAKLSQEMSSFSRDFRA